LTVSTLENEYSWVLNATLNNARIGLGTNGIIFYSGDWICGTFLEGDMYSANIYNITFVKGNIYGYSVYNDFNILRVDKNVNNSNIVWYDGGVIYGTWYAGIMYNGDFDGIWYNGNIYNGNFNGIWYNGNFSGGNFNGIWYNGTFSESTNPSIWSGGIFYGGDFLNGRWLNGIFDQNSGKISTFGKGGTLLHPAIWEYGLFKLGEFHSGDDTTNRYSIWYNGNWKNGIFYGGQINLINWIDGIFVNGIYDTIPQITNVYLRSDFSTLEVEFDRPHYFKELNNIENSICILGEPEIIDGDISVNSVYMGNNLEPRQHTIIEIISDTKVGIRNPILPENLAFYRYDIGWLDTLYLSAQLAWAGILDDVNGTNGSNSLYHMSRNCGCIDFTHIVNYTVDTYTIKDLINFTPRIASKFHNGEFQGGIWMFGYFYGGKVSGGIMNECIWNDGTFG
jgi:hypothetical protein